MKNIVLVFISLFIEILNLNAQCSAVISNSMNVTCFGGTNGQATVVASGGIAPYTYLWNTTPQQMTATATNLVAGNYTVVVIDADSCIATASVNIFQPPVLNVSITSIGTDCNYCNGSVTATVNGGTTPYTYIWSNGFSGPIMTDICEGAYYLTVMDANGCLTNAQSSVLISNPINIVLDSLINMNCSNNTNGSISIHATGGSGIYFYQWSGMGLTSYSSSINNLTTPGTYSITVIDSDSCYTSAYYTLLNNYNLYASITASNANCLNNGIISVIATGAHPPFTYLWNDSLHQTTQTAVGLNAGIYTVTVTDAMNCFITGTALIMSNCSNIIKGRVYNDLNQNCIQDIGESGLPGIYVMASPGPYYANTDFLGDYNIETPNLNSTLTIYNQLNLTPTCPASGVLNINFIQMGDTISDNNFGYYKDSNYFDLGIHPGWTSASPGFEKRYWICYFNNSLVPHDALIRFVYDTLLIYNSSTMGGIHYPAQHKIEWQFYNIPPSYSWNWLLKPEIYFHVPQTASINSLISSYFEILPIVGDIFPSNNTLSITEPITGSHDPNSKSVIPKGMGNDGFISTSDSILFYTIHFQNNGNDTCFTVVVTDTLSPYLNPVTVVPGAASHPYTFHLSNHGILTFRFDHILLPDSSTNEPESNGYFNFSVKINPNIPIGTVISNKAGIYFDFNQPVITNTVINTIKEISVTNSIVFQNYEINFSPNPFSKSTTFIAKSDKYNSYDIELYDLLGKKIRSVNNITEKQYTLDCFDIDKGVYIFKIYSKNSIISTGKLIKN